MFTDALLHEAIDKDWFVIDMKKDWKAIFGEGVVSASEGHPAIQMDPAEGPLGTGPGEPTC